MSNVTVTFNVTVAPQQGPPLTISSGPGPVTLPGETVGAADKGDSLGTVSGGTPPYTFQVSKGSLPPGMQVVSTVNPDGSETLEIEGTPTQSGDFSFDLTVTDSAGATTQLRKTVAQ